MLKILAPTYTVFQMSIEEGWFRITLMDHMAVSFIAALIP